MGRNLSISVLFNPWKSFSPYSTNIGALLHLGQVKDSMMRGESSLLKCYSCRIVLNQRWKRRISDVFISPEPVTLWRCISVWDIAFVILKTPWGDNYHIPFPDPGALFDLPFNPSHAGYPVKTTDSDMVRPHHQFSKSKLLTVILFGKTDPDYFCSAGRVLCFKDFFNDLFFIRSIIYCSNPTNSDS